jgi:hypothetical protein
MISSRRLAQLGLSGASLVLVTSVAILLKGSADATPQSVALTHDKPIVQPQIAVLSPTNVTKN